MEDFAGFPVPSCEAQFRKVASEAIESGDCARLDQVLQMSLVAELEFPDYHPALKKVVDSAIHSGSYTHLDTVLAMRHFDMHVLKKKETLMDVFDARA